MQNNTIRDTRFTATALFTTFLTGATIFSGRMLENAPQAPTRGRREGRVTVIVPARNEERNIVRAVGSLLVAAKEYGEATVLVVDDGSSDATPQLLHELSMMHPAREHLQVLRLDEALPEGWMGKPRACWQGALHEAAQAADWLLFVDADTESSPDLIERLVAGAVETRADLYSIFTDQQLGSVAERLTMPHIFYVLAVGFNWKSINDPQSEIAIANGQCILIKRAVYEALEGHYAVRNAIAEDKALAESIKRSGYRLFVAEGRDLMKTRMYTSLSEIWEGWSKNAYWGLEGRAWLLLVAVFFGIAGGIVPFIGFPAALRQRRWADAVLWGITLVTLLQNRDRAMREFNVPRWYALTLPIGALLCCGIAFSAWYKVVSGEGVTWKGRRYHS